MDGQDLKVKLQQVVDLPARCSERTCRSKNLRATTEKKDPV